MKQHSHVECGLAVYHSLPAPCVPVTLYMFTAASISLAIAGVALSPGDSEYTMLREELAIALLTASI